MKTVAIFAVHPDDETIGAGATLLKHKSNGDRVFWIIMTKMDEVVGFSKERIDSRQREIKKVEGLYGFDGVYQLPFITSRMDTYSMGEIVSEVSKIVNIVKPEVVYIPFKSDVHTDHQVSFTALISLTKQFRYPYVKKILSMEVVSETNFGHLDSRDAFWPNYYVDTSAHFQKKMEILRVYSSEIQEHPYSRSFKNIEALSILRGSEINVQHAEAFQLIKEIE